MKSKNFDKAKYNYDNGLWSFKQLHAIVNKKQGITPEEFEEITGVPYTK